MYFDEYGNGFTGPYGVGTYFGDEVTSYPTEEAAREAALQACTASDPEATVYGPQRGTQTAKILATFEWDGTKAVLQ